MSHRRGLLLLLGLLALGCGAAPGGGPPNFLIAIADDVGVRQVGAYAEHPQAGPTPTLDRLAREGVLFRTAWAAPVCSPSRAMLLTGQYPHRNGIGAHIRHDQATPGLPTGLPTLPKLLAPGHASAAFGKWHLAGREGGELQRDHPRESGFQHFAGTLFNLTGEQHYWRWPRTVDGVRLPGWVPDYATSAVVDDASAWIRAARQPWLVWLAFHAAHTPLHAPPEPLRTTPLSGRPGASPVAHYRAMVEALDHELGRLLGSMPAEVRARTVVIVLGDNGPPSEAVPEPFLAGRDKRSLYEGGLRVPLVIAGPAIPATARGRQSPALASIADVFATVVDLAGVEAPASDGRSLRPFLQDPDAPSARRHLYAELFAPNGPGPYRRYEQAVRGERYKLIRRRCRDRELYDLETDPFEQRNLLAATPLPALQAAARQRLGEALERIAGDACQGVWDRPGGSSGGGMPRAARRRRDES